MLFIATYIIVGLFLHVSGAPDAWLNALIPSLAFILSTLTLSIFKRLWKKRIHRA